MAAAEAEREKPSVDKQRDDAASAAGVPQQAASSRWTKEEIWYKGVLVDSEEEVERIKQREKDDEDLLKQARLAVYGTTEPKSPPGSPRRRPSTSDPLDSEALQPENASDTTRTPPEGAEQHLDWTQGDTLRTQKLEFQSKEDPVGRLVARHDADSPLKDSVKYVPLSPSELEPIRATPKTQKSPSLRPGNTTMGSDDVHSHARPAADPISSLIVRHRSSSSPETKLSGPALVDRPHASNPIALDHDASSSREIVPPASSTVSTISQSSAIEHDRPTTTTTITTTTTTTAEGTSPVMTDAKNRFESIRREEESKLENDVRSKIGIDTMRQLEESKRHREDLSAHFEELESNRIEAAGRRTKLFEDEKNRVQELSRSPSPPTTTPDYSLGSRSFMPRRTAKSALASLAADDVLTRSDLTDTKTPASPVEIPRHHELPVTPTSDGWCRDTYTCSATKVQHHRVHQEDGDFSDSAVKYSRQLMDDFHRHVSPIRLRQASDWGLSSPQRGDPMAMLVESRREREAEREKRVAESKMGWEQSQRLMVQKREELERQLVEERQALERERAQREDEREQRRKIMESKRYLAEEEDPNESGASSSQDVYSPEECPQTPSVHVEQAESPGSPPMEAIRLEPRQRFRTHRDDVMDGFWVLVSHQWHPRKWNLFWLLVGMLAMRWWCGPQKTLS